jgi:hypothetical protein
MASETVAQNAEVQRGFFSASSFELDWRRAASGCQPGLPSQRLSTVWLRTKKCPDLSGLAIAGREMEQRDIEAQLCVLPAQRLGFLIGAQREFCRAWPNQSAVTGERGRTLPSGGLAGRGGFSHAKFCHQGASSWSNQRKTRREGRSPLKSGSIVFLDRAW